MNSETHCSHSMTVFNSVVCLFQCINAVHEAAQKLSSKLSDHVQEVCFQELLVFVKRWGSCHLIKKKIIELLAQRCFNRVLVFRYEAEQTEGLGRKATEQIHPQTIHFLKTLKTCKELKWVLVRYNLLSYYCFMCNLCINVIEKTGKILIYPITGKTFVRYNEK